MAAALQRFPAIRLHALYVASNHLHAVVTDEDGSLSAFCGFFLGNLAKDVNELVGRLGPVFHRRFSAEPILDDDAVVERITYLVCNPVADRLVSCWRRWPGLLLWAGDGRTTERSFRRLDIGAYAAARRAARSASKVHERDFFKTASLLISDPSDSDGRPFDPDRTRAAVAARSAALGSQTRGQRVLGQFGVVARDPHQRPTHTARSPRPLCHASDIDLRIAFRRAWRTLVAAYRCAAARFRGGETETRFPAFTFPPWRPLVGTAT